MCSQNKSKIANKCVICGFDEGHFVCSKAPANENYNSLLRENAALKQELEKLKIQSLDAFDKQREKCEKEIDALKEERDEERQRADSNLDQWHKVNHEHSEFLVKNGEQLIEIINVKKERDRYKVALEEIESGSSFKTRYAREEITASDMQKIAKEALSEATPPSEVK